MGWKSTKSMSKRQVIEEIYNRIDDATDRQLCDILEILTEEINEQKDYDSDLYGYNFIIDD